MLREYTFAVKIQAYSDEFNPDDPAKTLCDAIETVSDIGDCIGHLIQEAHVKLIYVDNVDKREE